MGAAPGIRALALLLLVCLLPAAYAGPAALAMPDSYSATAAEQVIDSGGNAVDAAVAAAFVLAVTYPEAGNIGGGGFMLSHMAGEAAFLDIAIVLALVAFLTTVAFARYVERRGREVPGRGDAREEK